MAQKILAENLQQWDKIIIPASSVSNERQYRVTTVPEVGELTVNAMGCKVYGGLTQENETALQFGRKVELNIERPQ